MTTKSSDKPECMRLDKWLWCARFYKTRSIAANAIKSGKIRIHGERPRPAKTISPGDTVLIRKDAFNYEIIIRKLPRARLSACMAILLYEESDESIQNRQQTGRQLKVEAAMFPRTIGRPTKRDRRDLMKFKKAPCADKN